MGRGLIVANRTLGGLRLLDEVRRRVAAGASGWHVLAPVGQVAGEPQRGASRAAAEERLGAELERLAAIGAEVTGEVVEGDVAEAVEAAMATERFDEVVVCTLPAGLSRWLERGLVDRVRELVDVPVVHVTAPAGIPSRMRTTAVRLTVYVGESDQHGHHPLYTEIVHRARDAGLAGATVLRGLEGFGASQVVHTARLLTFSEDLPMVVVLIDTAEHIDAFLPVLDELVTEGLVVREDVDVIKYAGRHDDGSG
jgi:PII-like signaling protein